MFLGYFEVLCMYVTPRFISYDSQEDGAVLVKLTSPGPILSETTLHIHALLVTKVGQINETLRI